MDEEKVMGDKDIYLRYAFTDRGGAKVYDAFSGHDRLKQLNKLFRIRISDDKAPEIVWADTDQQELKL